MRPYVHRELVVAAHITHGTTCVGVHLASSAIEVARPARIEPRCMYIYHHVSILHIPYRRNIIIIYLLYLVRGNQLKFIIAGLDSVDQDKDILCPDGLD